MKKSVKKEILRLIKYAVTWLVALGVYSLALLIGCAIAPQNVGACKIVSFVLMSLFVFAVCRRMVFRSVNKWYWAIGKEALFCGVTVAIFDGIITHYNQTQNMTVVACTSIAYVLLHYLYSRFVVYGKHTDSIYKVPLSKLRGTGWFFKLSQAIAFKLYGKVSVEGVENLGDEPCIVIGNHCQMHGPVSLQMHHPRSKLIWTISQMTDPEEIANFAYTDFWSGKPKSVRWLYKILAECVAPLLLYYFRRADVIPVYFGDARLRQTLRNTITALESGDDVVVFAESHTPYNNIINYLQDQFVDVTTMYYKKSKKCVNFVPMYVCPALRKIIYGTPLKYNPELSLEQQRETVRMHVSDEITRIALTLPPHRVVPFDNIDPKDYPMSK